MAFLAALIFISVAALVLWVVLGEDKEETEENQWKEYP